jgi:hypothetical protein
MRGCGSVGKAGDKFNRNAEKLIERIAKKQNRTVSVSVSPDLSMQELRKLSF